MGIMLMETFGQLWRGLLAWVQALQGCPAICFGNQQGLPADKSYAQAHQLYRNMSLLLTRVRLHGEFTNLQVASKVRLKGQSRSTPKLCIEQASATRWHCADMQRLTTSCRWRSISC